MLRTLLLCLALLCGALPAPAAPAAPAAGACYPADIPAPPLRSQTLVVFDETSARDPTAWRDFQAAVQRLAADPAQRLVMLRFAGIAPGQLVARDMDTRLDAAITDPDQIAELRIGPFKRSQACVKRQWAAAQQAVQAQLAAWSSTQADQLARSEIVYALRRVVADFATPGLPSRLLVYSDGVQNGSGLVFYNAGKPRDIDPALEARRLAQAGQHLPEQAGPARLAVHWWGLLVDTPAPARAGRTADARYASAQMIEHYSRFWREALLAWGASSVQIGPTLNNPDLQDIRPPGS